MMVNSRPKEENIIKDKRNIFRLNYTAIKDVRNLIRLVKETKAIKGRILRGMKNLLRIKSKKIIINQQVLVIF